MRSAAVSRLGGVTRMMQGAGGVGGASPRYFSDGKGRVLGEEERAKETVFIQKMERERQEKLKQKAEKEKEKEKEGGDKKTEEPHKS